MSGSCHSGGADEDRCRQCPGPETMEFWLARSDHGYSSALRLDSCGTSGGRGPGGRLVPEQVGGLDGLRSIRGGLLAHGSGAIPAALPEVQPALVIVVTPAAQFDLVHRRLAAEGVGVHVMELHEPALVAAMAARADETATPEVPNPDGAFHCGRGVTRPRMPRARPTRLRRVGELPLGQVHEQSGEGP